MIRPAGTGRQGLLAVVVALVVTSCSSSSPPAATEPAVSDSADTTVASATRAKPNPGASNGDWQIGWVHMDERSVEVEWQPAEGNGTYKLFRVLSVGTDPSTVDLVDSDLVYSGQDTRFVDETVEADSFYTYVVVLSSDPSSRRWTDTLTTTDVTQPSPISGLTAEVVDDGIKLTWDPSSDEVEFASYAVSAVGDDEELTYIGGGADESVTSFIDTEWSGATTIYVVQAVDFHNNRTEPVEIVVG